MDQLSDKPRAAPEGKGRRAADLAMSGYRSLTNGSGVRSSIQGVDGAMDCSIECISVGEGLMRKIMRLELVARRPRCRLAPGHTSAATRR